MEINFFLDSQQIFFDKLTTDLRASAIDCFDETEYESKLSKDYENMLVAAKVEENENSVANVE